MFNLSSISSPQDLKGLEIADLSSLSGQIRELIIDCCECNGGHLGSNLGCVELTVALHHVFDSPNDKLIFDVGHQAYTHKILTGRQSQMRTLRQKNGLSGFPRPTESEHDPAVAGHAGNSISMALGLSYGLPKNNWSIAIIGDGSIANGMAVEALNHLGTTKQNVLIVLNDNGLAIDPTQGALAQGQDYEKFFQALGINYQGVIDGHDLKSLLEVFTAAKNKNVPQVVHVKTIKGQGYIKALDNKLKCHGISPCRNGEIKAEKTNQNIVAETLVDLAAEHKNINLVVAAMGSSVGLGKFQDLYPDRYFDVGIAESHGVAFSAGLATTGDKKVFCHLYSTFMQRSFDQLIHDVAIAETPVVFLVDRAGLAGEDGCTHQGQFDLAYLNLIPNIHILAPRGAEELELALRSAVNYKHPLVIRYTKDMAVKNGDSKIKNLKLGSRAMQIGEGKVAILSTGQINIPIKQLKAVSHYHFPFLKPFDEKFLKKIAEKYGKIIVIEEGTVKGGFAATVSSYLNKLNYQGKVRHLALPDKFIDHGGREQLLRENGFSLENLSSIIKK
ncbi:MAG: 1-deoxy-D-xylulose-5-phosphate synthase [Pseudomonadales bacterium]|jgi:1-deoxy-D-xylulose-5-phosphate synthase|nr:1-deoxy-D-xylulose-5-phosphate synthase [Pseudomonadales bacterium]